MATTTRSNATAAGTRTRKDKQKIIKFKCHVTILQGRRLAPKDRILGLIKLTSDPYVEVWANGELQGKTPVHCFTVNPVWTSNNEFTVENMVEAHHLPPPKLELKIWDQDTGRDPDAMGTITMIVPARNDDTTEWYQVPKHSAKNAKGELQVRIRTERIVRKKKSKKDKDRKSSKSSKAGRKSAPALTTPVSSSSSSSKNNRQSRKSKSPTGRKSAPTAAPESSSKRITTATVRSLEPAARISSHSKSPTRQRKTVTVLAPANTRSSQKEERRRSKSPKLARKSAPAASSLSSRTSSSSKSPERRDDSDASSTSSSSSLSESELPPPVVQPRRTMMDTPDLPNLQVHQCYKTLNEEDPLWEGVIQELKWEIDTLKQRIQRAKAFTTLDDSSDSNFHNNSLKDIVQHLQQEVQERIQRKEERLEKLQLQQCLMQKLQLSITIVQAVGLVAKCHDEYGRKLSSDPYVEVWRDQKVMLGKTETKDYTLDPIWNEQFVVTVDLEEKEVYLPKFTLRVWNEDFETQPDRLGTIKLETPTDEVDTLEWYEIPRGTNNSLDAMGFVQVRVESKFVVGRKCQVDQLQKQIDCLEHELHRVQLVDNASKMIDSDSSGRNTLEPTMKYLLEKNKELVREVI